MCLRIQESRFRINLGVVDHRRRVFQLQKAKKCLFLPIAENRKTRENPIFLTFSNFFVGNAPKYRCYRHRIIRKHFSRLRKVILVLRLTSYNAYKTLNAFQSILNCSKTMVSYTNACCQLRQHDYEGR